MIVPENVKNIIFVSEGGLGKVIASTAVVSALKKKYPEKRIIVVSGYPDVFSYNPDVFKVFRFDNPHYFYDDFITPESFLIHAEPYRHHDYIHGSRHMIDIWCEMAGVPYSGEVPALHFLKREDEAGEEYVRSITGGGKKKFALLQWVGGIVPAEKNNGKFIDSITRMHRRSLPKSVAQKIVNKLISRDYVVGVVQAENFPDIEGASRITFPIRSTINLLKHCHAFIGIDSFMQHSAKALGIPGVVCWGGTSPSRLGYDIHKNIERKVCPTPFCHRPNSYIFDANPSGFIWNCQYDDKCMEFDADEIIQALEDLQASKRE